MIFRKNHCSQRGVETRGWNDSQYLEEYNIENMYKKKKMSQEGAPAASTEVASTEGPAAAAPAEVQDAASTAGKIKVEPPTDAFLQDIVDRITPLVAKASGTAPLASAGDVDPAAALGADVNVKPPTPEELAAAQANVDAAKTASEADATNDALKTALTDAEAELAALNAKAAPAAAPAAASTLGGRRRTKRKNGKKSHKKGKSSKKVAKRRKSRKSSSSRRRRSSRKQNKH